MSLPFAIVRATAENSKPFSRRSSGSSHNTSLPEAAQAFPAGDVSGGRPKILMGFRPLSWLFDLFFGCRHKSVTLPFNDRQTCLDCGSSRLYLFDTDFEHANAGIFKGPWQSPQHPHNSARQVADNSADLSFYYPTRAKSRNDAFAWIDSSHAFEAFVSELDAKAQLVSESPETAVQA